MCWPFLVLGLLGLGVSGYAIHVHQLVAAGGSSACGISATVNCDAVIGSKYGVLLGLPLGVWGMAYFAVMLLTATSDADTSRRLAALMRLAVSGAGFVAVLGLAYISYLIIKVSCPVCMTIHAVITLAFLYSLLECWRLRRKKGISKTSP